MPDAPIWHIAIPVVAIAALAVTYNLMKKQSQSQSDKPSEQAAEENNDF